ncbi:MAG: sensor histidine kinase [Solirubrobacteraceae bacterium]
MRGGALLALGLALLASVLCYAAYGSHAGWTCLAILGPVGALTVLVVDRLLARRARLGAVRRQLAVGVAIVVGQLLLAAALFVLLMSSTSEDALFTAVLALYTGALGVWAARTVGRGVLSDIDGLRVGVAAVAAGSREVNIGVRGGDELALVAGDIERLAAMLGAEEQSRAKLEASRRDLLAAISHDLRTPITSLRLLSEALQDDLIEEPELREQYVARLGTHVRALGNLIDDLFELSRLEAGELRWSMERVPLEELVLETVDAMRPQAEAEAVLVCTDLPAGLAAAHANPEQIQRVLFNLIQNAIRHAPADGSVTVRAAAAQGAVEVQVSDTGEGIPSPERERIFEAFVQGSGRGSRSDGSAGLGLAISRAIVEAHGGRIWVDDAASGASVRFSLPSAA